MNDVNNPAGNKRVFEAAGASRSSAVTCLVLAVPLLVVVVALAQHRLEAIITSIIFAAIFSLGMNWALQWTAKKAMPEPLVVTSDELPPIDSIWRAVIWSAVVFAVLDAGTAFYVLSHHPQDYSTVGMVLSLPAIFFASYRRVLQTQHDFHGTLWVVAQTTWTSKRRIRYVVPYQRGSSQPIK